MGGELNSISSPIASRLCSGVGCTSLIVSMVEKPPSVPLMWLYPLLVLHPELLSCKRSYLPSCVGDRHPAGFQVYLNIFLLVPNQSFDLQIGDIFFFSVIIETRGGKVMKHLFLALIVLFSAQPAVASDVVSLKAAPLR